MLALFILAVACWTVAVWQWFIAERALRTARLWQDRYLREQQLTAPLWKPERTDP